MLSGYLRDGVGAEGFLLPNEEEQVALISGRLNSWRDWPFWLRLLAVILAIPFIAAIIKGFMYLGEKLIQVINRAIADFTDQLINLRFDGSEDLVQLSVILAVVVLILRFLFGGKGRR